MFGNEKNHKSIGEISIIGPQNGFYRKSDKPVNTQIVKMKELFAYECISWAPEFDMVEMNESEIEKFRLTSDDLIFGRRSLVLEGAGKCRRIGNLKGTVVFESSLLRITLDREQVMPRFIQEWFESAEGDKAITSIRSVTTISGIKGSDLRKISVPVPNMEKQRQFIDLCEQSDKSKLLECKRIFIIKFYGRNTYAE